ncbi:MAG: hypothetical protein PUK31_02820 [Candidatus Methanomethylophilaceae archaeon]|nr:hypothetical protein [Candidatus Methanomethylophilaceae archaeon]MDY5873154.1 hypothetical protein [Candidatus Methanomethylophilaceae archaeon]
MDGKITDAKNLVYVLAFIFIALFAGLSFVNAFASTLMLTLALIFMVFGVFVYGIDGKDSD